MKTSIEHGARVYIPGKEEDGEEPWLRAEVREVKSGGWVVVRLQEDGRMREVDLAGFGGGPLPLQNSRDVESVVEDMCKMDHLHEAALLDNLQRRAGRRLPYTYTGPIVIAVNPYEWIDDLYSPTTANRYLRSKSRDELPPHIYATAMTAYNGLLEGGEDQSILVSGESGAGKTESVKIMMSMLAVASKSRAGASKQQEQRKGSKQLAGEGVEVVDRVLRSNPLLESFGNAKTVRNDNSSRFGKFQQLQFSPLGVLVGSHCQTYLLEKSRVVGQASGERNYHIFYQLLRGPESWKGKVKLGGMGVEDFAYLAGGDLDTKVIEGVDDGKRFTMTVDALKVVGVEESQVQVMMSVLAGVLHVGNIELRSLDDDKCEVSSPGSLQTASQLLGCPSAEALSRVLCYRTVTAAGEVYQVPMPQHQAQHCRDALAKELYSRVFTWLVHAINRNTAAPPPAAAAHKKASRSGRSSPYGAVSLLDIFGFESLQVNSFEQFLINFANETLQQKFCYDIFKGVQAEYESEGVVWTHVDFQDNAETLGLIEGRMGVISVLNEECLRPKATDTSFISKLAALHAEHPNFDRPKLGAKDSFIVCHYAGRVQYEGVGFLEKNRDTLQADLSDLLGRSQVSLIAELFAPQDDAAAGHHHHHHHRSGGHRRQGTLVAETVSTKFRRQLSQLMGEISRTQVQYVRCLKPNSIKAGGVFDGRLIVDQLRYAGVLEGIRVSRAAYPNRLPHGDFLHRFGVLLPLASSLRTDIRAAIQALLPAAAKDKARCQVGKTRVYFRAGVLEELEERRRKVLAVRVTKAQAAWRSYVWRRTYLELRAACVWTQSRRRMVVCRRSFVRQQQAALSLQCWARAVAAREALQGLRREAAASKLQAWVRGRKQRQAFKDARGGMVLLQSRIRRARAKKQAIELKAQADQQRKLEEQLQRLKAKLQEAGSTQVIVQQDREETLAMLQRLQEENQLLREENDGLRRQVQELKGKASTLQQHNATLEEKLASVLLTLKNRPAAPSAYYPSNLGQGTIRGGLAVGKGPTSQAGARGVRVLTEADLFSTQPLDPARSLVTRDDLLTLPDRVDVTLSCGKRYLCGGGGSKAMLQWLDTIGSSSSGGGPPSSARFILERAVDGGSRYCYRLRLRDSRRYVSLGGFFQRSRFRLTERRPEEAALFALQPVAHSRAFFHLNPQQQPQPAAATGSERGEDDEAEADEGEREARRLLLFQLLLHRPRREGAPLVLTPDGFVSFLGGPNSNATARSAVGPIAADGAGGCVFSMEAASLQHNHEEHEDLGYGLDKDLRAPKLSKRMRLFGSSNNSSSSQTLRRTLLTPTSSQVAAEQQQQVPAAGLSRPAAGSSRRVASRVGGAVSSFLSSVFAAPAPAPPVKKEKKKGGKRVTTATTYTTIGDRPMAAAPPAPRQVSPAAPPPRRTVAPTAAAAPVASSAAPAPPPVMNVGPPLSARSLRETGSYCSSQSMTGSTSWGPHYDHRDMQGSSVDDELLMMPGGAAGHLDDLDSRSVYHTVIHGINEEDDEDDESEAGKRKQSGGCSFFLELLLALLWLAVAALGAYVWYQNGGTFGGVFSTSLAREAPFRLREASSRKCFTGSRFVSCQSPQASSFTLLVPRGTDYHTQGGMLQETATGLCLHVGKRDVLTLGSCSDLSRAQGWQLMGGHLTNVLHGHIVVGKKGKVLPASTKKANRAMLQGVAMLSSRDGVEASFSSFASLLIK